MLDSDGLGPLLDATGQGVLILDDEGRITRANTRVAELFGYGAEELLGESVDLLVPLGLRERHAAHRRRYATAPRGGVMAAAIDCRGRRKDGTHVAIEVHLGSAATANGRRVMALVRDITASRRAERRLQAEYAVTRVLAEGPSLREATPRLLAALGECLGLEVGELWLVDRAGDVIRWAGSWALPGIDISALDVAAREATFKAGRGLAGRVWATGRPEWVSDILQDPQFRRRAAASAIGLRAACAFPVVQGDAAIGAMVYFNRDVRTADAEVLDLVADVGRRVGLYIAHKRAQEDFESERELMAHHEKLAGLGRLAAGVVHELNNPLGIVASRAELLLHDAAAVGLPEHVVDDLRVVHRHARRAAEITQALLAFARRTPRERETVDVNGVVQDCLRSVPEIGMSARVAVDTALAPALPPVVCDRAGVRQALLAVLKNAYEAMPNGGRVRVATEPDATRPGWVRVSVTDTGPGIPFAERPHLFEPFHTTKPRARGLGLAMAYGIVRDHGGQIDVHSPPAGGTTVVLSLPAGDVAESARSARDA